MAKYTTPGIKFTEIDNTVRTESEPGLGIGAIVMCSNKGPVNQRIVTSNYGEFTDIFGKPESIDHTGHFAAENYFNNSTQLFAVRATQGDEQYSQIQFSYQGAPVTATNSSNDTAKFTYVDSEGDSNLNLLQPFSAVQSYDTLVSAGIWQLDGGDEDPTGGEFGFALKQKGYYGFFNDIVDETEDIIVFKGNTDNGWEGAVAEEGKHIIYPTSVDSQGTNPQLDTKFMMATTAYNECSASPSQVRVTKGANYYDITVDVPASAMLDQKKAQINFAGDLAASATFEEWEASGVNYKDIFKEDIFYGDYDNWDDISANSYGITDAYRMELMDWDQPEIKKVSYVDKDFFDANVGQAYGIKYTEYFNVNPSYALVGKKDLVPEGEGESVNTEFVMCSAVSAMYLNPSTTREEWLGNDDIPARTPREVIIDMLDAYGNIDLAEINQYNYLKYYDIPTNSLVEKIVKEPESYYRTDSKDKESFKKHVEEYLFWLFAEKDERAKLTYKAVYVADDSELVTLPIQAGHQIKNEDGTITTLNNIIAQPTSYLVNSVDKTYADGYTLLTDSDDEPGNGDIERYRSVFDDQLVIASIGPGNYGDDVGISIITTECSEIQALQHQNAFNWKYAYDDEDRVDSDTTDYTQNPLDLTWKKVFRINVYIKGKSQTAEAAWGTGMDALIKDPVESWYVSTDPYAKDGDGNSLYAPTVINGHSDYIYVSRSSASAAANNRGKFVQPNQTYAIYGLTGGRNSTKNNIAEKTAALDFYRDRQRAQFDILFNVEPVDSFNGRQRHAAHQRKIAQIAAARTQDIGVVQVTSKSAKTVKQMLSEAANFSFAKGDYVAEYGGYDKFYDADIASWVYLPKSVAGACAMAYCDTFFYSWNAPAGVARGTIGYTSGQLLKLTDDEIGQLYTNNVNTSRDCGNYGTVLYGQKTALKKNSLLNRINIRRCMNYIEKILENKMTPYLFQMNSVNTRSSMRNDITEFLQRVKAAEGIYNFSVSVTQDDTDPTIVNVNIKVQPTSVIEFIDVKIYIENQTMTITEG